MDKRGLVDYSPWGRKESDMTEHTHTHTGTHTCTHTHTYELPEHLLLSGAAMGMPWALTPLLRKSEKSVSVGL